MKHATIRTKETARGTRTASNGSRTVRRPTGTATVSDRAFERTLTQRIAKDREVLLALAEW